MSRNNCNDESIRAFGYIARPKREAVQDGVLHKYWTVRCRRKGEEGEWGLGTFGTRRLAEQAFHAWVMARQQVQVPSGGKAAMLDVLQEYRKVVESMTDKRDATIRSRLYTAGQLESFLRDSAPSTTIGSFDDAMFFKYKEWLNARYSTQTCQTAVTGARTFLKWATASGFTVEPPKAPRVDVPESRQLPLYSDILQAVVAAATPPCNLLLRVLWEAGLRIAEATSLHRKDIVIEDDCAGNGFVVIEKRDRFTPKTARSNRRVPITRELAESLRNLASSDDELLFPTATHHPYHYWRTQLQKAQLAAGLTDKDQFTFHDLRRAMADNLRRAATPIDVYCRFMGHSVITGLRHYSVVSDEDLIKAHEQGLANARKRAT